MQEPRFSFSVVAVDGVIYAIGGDFEYQANLDRVERYSPNTDSWRYNERGTFCHICLRKWFLMGLKTLFV